MKLKISVPLNSHNDYLKKLECFKLERKFSENYVQPLPSQLREINHRGAVWNIELSNGKSCQMLTKFGAIDHEFYTIHVDAQKFYYYWLASSLILSNQHRSNDCVLLKHMPHDRKFNDAVRGFHSSIHSDNPVPLAQVAARYENGDPYLGFINGVTRTMWLLVNGARSFPISVHKLESAQYLYEFSGISEAPITDQELKEQYNVRTPYHQTEEFIQSLYKDEV